MEKHKGPCIVVNDVSNKKQVVDIIGEFSGVVKKTIPLIQGTMVLDSSSSSYSEFVDATHSDGRILEFR